MFPGFTPPLKRDMYLDAYTFDKLNDIMTPLNSTLLENSSTEFNLFVQYVNAILTKDNIDHRKY